MTFWDKLLLISLPTALVSGVVFTWLDAAVGPPATASGSTILAMGALALVIAVSYLVTLVATTVVFLKLAARKIDDRERGAPVGLSANVSVGAGAELPRVDLHGVALEHRGLAERRDDRDQRRARSLRSRGDGRDPAGLAAERTVTDRAADEGVTERVTSTSLPKKETNEKRPGCQGLNDRCDWPDCPCSTVATVYYNQRTPSPLRQG